MNKRVKKKKKSQMCIHYSNGLCGRYIYLYDTYRFCAKNQRQCSYYQNYIPEFSPYKLRRLKNVGENK